MHELLKKTCINPDLDGWVEDNPALAVLVRIPVTHYLNNFNLKRLDFALDNN